MFLFLHSSWAGKVIVAALLVAGVDVAADAGGRTLIDSSVVNTGLLIVLALVSARNGRRLQDYRPIREEDVLNVDESELDDGTPIVTVTKVDVRRAQTNGHKTFRIRRNR